MAIGITCIDRCKVVSSYCNLKCIFVFYFLCSWMASFCKSCGERTLNYRKHISRFHKVKYIGLECPVCNHFESVADKGLMMRHLKWHKDSKVNVEMTRCPVPHGYIVPIPCRECSFKAKNAETLNKHYQNAHDEMSDNSPVGMIKTLQGELSMMNVCDSSTTQMMNNLHL